MSIKVIGTCLTNFEREFLKIEEPEAKDRKGQSMLKKGYLGDI